MIRDENIQEELNNIAPGFPQKESVSPPAGYLESFPDALLNRWKQEESHPVVKSIGWQRIVGIAAMLIGFCIGGWWLLSTTEQTEAMEITSAEAYQYINENIGEFEAILESSDVQVDEVHLDIPKDAIEEYIMEETNGADPEELF